MNIPEEAGKEAQRRHPEWHDQGVGIVQGSHWRSGFIAGAEWARKEALREAAEAADEIDWYAGDRIRALADGRDIPPEMG
jgi:hypothetical protein